MFTNARMLALMAVSTAVGFATLTPQTASAQIYIERVYDTGCDSRYSDYAGTFTVDGCSYRISTRCSILDQVEEALLSRGYDVCRVGRTIRVYTDCGSPSLCFSAGLYDLSIRSRFGYYSISVFRADPCEDCETGYRRDGFRYRSHDGGIHLGIHLEFGDHDHEVSLHNRSRQRHDHNRDRTDHRDTDRDHSDNRGRDDYRDGGDHDRGRGTTGERSGGRSYVTPERPLDRPDSVKSPGAGGQTVDTPARRGTKLATPRPDDRSSLPGADDARDGTRQRVIVREPDAIKRAPSNPPATSTPPARRGGSTGNEKALPKPLPIQTPAAAPTKQPAKQQQPARQPSKQVTKEPSRSSSPASGAGSQPRKSDSGSQKKDRRW